MEKLMQDVRYALRMMRKSPGFIAAAILTLALGIGANSAIFSVVNGVLLRPLPYPDSDRLVWFWESQPHLDKAPFSGADYVDYAAQNHTFESVAAIRRLRVTLTGRGAPKSVGGGIVTGNYLAMLQVKPQIGRTLVETDGAPGAARVVVLDYDFWQSDFGGDPNVIGSSITLEGKPATIVGVLPASFKPPANVKFWMNPRDVVPELFPNSTDKVKTNRAMHYIGVVGKLKSGVSLQKAQADIDTIVANLQKQYASNAGHNVHLVSLREYYSGDQRTALLVIFCVVGTVLLIACANVANLMLSRSAARQREVAVRRALGASAARIARQLLTESAILGAAGGAAGMALAYGVLRWFATAGKDILPRTAEIHPDGRVIAFTFAAAIGSSILFGLAPVVQTMRVSLLEPLRGVGRGGSTGTRQRLMHDALVAAEIAMSLVLLVAAGLLMRSFMRLLEVKPGFHTENLATMYISFTGPKYARGEAERQLLQTLEPRIAALPGVESVAIANDLPLQGQDTTTGVSQIEGRPALKPGDQYLVGVHAVNNSYFRAMGVPLLRGREFNETDTAKSSPVVILNQKAAEELWPGQDPIGKHVQIMADKPSEVVGVVGNVLHNGVVEGPSSDSYAPITQLSWLIIAPAIRTRLDAGTIADEVRSELAKLDPDLPVYSVMTMTQVAADTMTAQRLTLDLVGAFAVLALLLATVGIYGVMSYAVTQRNREIGIRMALGAARGDVLRMVLGQGMRLALIGAGAGLAIAFAAVRLMSGLLFGIKASDPATFAGVTLLLGAVAAVACWIPARRATRVDPLVALRYE
ncbi:MAG TPA: ABC transporter permease [Candidatus Acidoferrales bacterium]|nr:ABC transporter permease [Candidatus Acidoferrales bacterium]